MTKIEAFEQYMPISEAITAIIGEQITHIAEDYDVFGDLLVEAIRKSADEIEHRLNQPKHNQ